ncbi:unnamed protein product [Trichogramma brassicae]|uniref:Small integral membrane protein 8 n=1 Tax=Trichogramma brassicae TaxID=86971 RepID=A0A6H5I8H5_9HYME|nr:unnamed protein product [Trichogramma brassicae]
MFRAINYELYVKPNNVVMAIGLIGMTGCIGYIAYMRSKYKDMGYYTAVGPDGTETFQKKVSKWEI